MKPVTDPKTFRESYLEAIYGAESLRFTLHSALEGDLLWNGRLFALITAANSRSQVLSKGENKLRNAMLEGELIARGWKYGSSFGTNRAASWREDGFIVWDETLDDVLELGREFEQNAIVYGASGWIALGWCDAWELERFKARLEPEL